jgi:hypothetical protein
VFGLERELRIYFVYILRNNRINAYSKQPYIVHVYCVVLLILSHMFWYVEQKLLVRSLKAYRICSLRLSSDPGLFTGCIRAATPICRLRPNPENILIKSPKLPFDKTTEILVLSVKNSEQGTPNNIDGSSARLWNNILFGGRGQSGPRTTG